MLTKLSGGGDYKKSFLNTILHSNYGITLNYSFHAIFFWKRYCELTVNSLCRGSSRKKFFVRLRPNTTLTYVPINAENMMLLGDFAVQSQTEKLLLVKIDCWVIIYILGVEVLLPFLMLGILTGLLMAIFLGKSHKINVILLLLFSCLRKVQIIMFLSFLVSD